MSLDRNFFNPSGADGQSQWKENVTTAIAVAVAVLIVALVAVLMGMG